jgi:hypothetical protein
MGLPDVGTIRDRRQEEASTDIPPDRGQQYPVTNMTPNLSVPSTFSRIPSTPDVVQLQEQIALQDQPYQFHKMGKGPKTQSSQSPRRQISTSGALKCPYSCDICGKRYSQPQGVGRHRREVHEARPCVYCHDYEWGRPYLYRRHMQRRHPDIGPDPTLQQTTGTRHNATMDTQLRRPTSTPPAITVSPLDDDPQPNLTTKKKKLKHEDPRQLAVFMPTSVRTTFHSPESRTPASRVGPKSANLVGP